MARPDRSELAVASLLGALGLAGALIAWRVGVAGSAASDATGDVLDATRLRGAQVMIGEGYITRTGEAYLDYERARRRADALAAAGLPEAAQAYRKEAASHWFLVRPEYLDPQGEYDPDRHRDAWLADAASREDLEPTPHLDRAEAEEQRMVDLLRAGLVVALGLPFLTVAQVTRGRLRLGTAAAGAALLAAGVLLGFAVWA
ncbi:MAG: hypothetical protein A2X23_06195 [Chloroflexi bacterium GWC2_73_18]|nr:MAG: hypothetical protein A2X23_06195 [Chloroflexi bacterium GWC2_73_18]